jgi:hypothetical protein
MGLDNYVADVDAHAESNAAALDLIDREFFDAGLELQSGPNPWTALGNSAKNPSPVFLTMWPPCSPITEATISARSVDSLTCVASSSLCMSREYPATSAATMAANLRPTLPGCASAMAPEFCSPAHYVHETISRATTVSKRERG